jgi:hypothetical protein
MCSGWGDRNISSLYRLPLCCKEVTCLAQAVMSPESHTDDLLPRRKWIRHEYQSHA